MAKPVAIDAMANPLERSSERGEKVYRKVTLLLMSFIYVAWVLNYRSLEHQLRAA